MNPAASPADAATVPLSPDMLRALAELHDLQLAGVGDPPPWFWLIVALVVAGAALVAWLWWRRPERRWLRRLRQVERSYRANCGRSPAVAAAGPELVAAIAALLREAATDPRRWPSMPAGLAGEDWLRWLDERAPGADRGVFVDGVGRDLLHWPFVPRERRTAPVDFDPARADALLTLAARWLRARA